MDRDSFSRIALNKKWLLVGIVVAIALGGLIIVNIIQSPQGNVGSSSFTPSDLQSGNSISPSTTQGAGNISNQTCTLTPSLIEVESTPQQTEGPYFVDEMLNRSDIRSDPSTGLVEDGIPLNLVIHVYNVIAGKSCLPLRNAHVDLWHTNSQGLYSDIGQSGTVGKKFLRGYQETDDKGTVHFITIYPGWYEGRAIHIHIKVRIFEGAAKTFEWTSQFYLDDSTNNKVHNLPPYNKHGLPVVSNSEDSIYSGPSTDGMMSRGTGSHLMLNLTRGIEGYNATFNVGLHVS